MTSYRNLIDVYTDFRNTILEQKELPTDVLDYVVNVCDVSLQMLEKLEEFINNLDDLDWLNGVVELDLEGNIHIGDTTLESFFTVEFINMVDSLDLEIEPYFEKLNKYVQDLKVHQYVKEQIYHEAKSKIEKYRFLVLKSFKIINNLEFSSVSKLKPTNPKEIADMIIHKILKAKSREKAYGMIKYGNLDKTFKFGGVLLFLDSTSKTLKELYQTKNMFSYLNVSLKNNIYDKEPCKVLKTEDLYNKVYELFNSQQTPKEGMKLELSEKFKKLYFLVACYRDRSIFERVSIDLDDVVESLRNDTDTSFLSLKEENKFQKLSELTYYDKLVVQFDNIKAILEVYEVFKRNYDYEYEEILDMVDGYLKHHNYEFPIYR